MKQKTINQIKSVYRQYSTSNNLKFDAIIRNLKIEDLEKNSNIENGFNEIFKNLISTLKNKVNSYYYINEEVFIFFDNEFTFEEELKELNDLLLKFGTPEQDLIYNQFQDFQNALQPLLTDEPAEHKAKAIKGRVERLRLNRSAQTFINKVLSTLDMNITDTDILFNTAKCTRSQDYIDFLTEPLEEDQLMLKLTEEDKIRAEVKKNLTRDRSKAMEDYKNLLS